MFEAFPKIPRLMRECTITEKLDGTNAQVWIVPEAEQTWDMPLEALVIARGTNNTAILAGSRKRFITPSDDNFGFARWVSDHADELIEGLGAGRHYGEWWGSGIQRRYGLDHKRFSLFNTKRWMDSRTDDFTGDTGQTFAPSCCHVVPVLYQGGFSTTAINEVMLDLYNGGSVAAPGFKEPEGIMVFHHAAYHMFKYTLGGDGHKG